MKLKDEDMMQVNEVIVTAWCRRCKHVLEYRCFNTTDLTYLGCPGCDLWSPIEARKPHWSKGCVKALCATRGSPTNVAH